MYHYKARCMYGYYEKYIDVYTDKRLENMPYAQAGVNIYDIVGSTRYDLISYETLVLTLCNNAIKLYINPAYSRSTGKHVSAFLKEYAPELSYYDLKEAYINGKFKTVRNSKHYIITREN